MAKTFFINKSFILAMLAAVLCLCFTIVGCKNKITGHIPAADMQQTLLDINLAEAYCIMVKDSLHKGGTKNLDSLSVYYQEIFAHHNITQEQFIESLAWYKNHPEELDTLYNNLIPKVAGWLAKPAK
jgi:hypothetical protein